MLKLDRRSSVFATPWFLASAVVAGFMLGTAFMAATDSSGRYEMQPWTMPMMPEMTSTWIETNEMVMVVRVPQVQNPVQLTAP